MAKPARARKTWIPSEEQRLKELIRGNTPTRLIAVKLQRSEDAIRSKAKELHQSLKPTNQKPYNRRRR
jgi:hypothetical protein